VVGIITYYIKPCEVKIVDSSLTHERINNHDPPKEEAVQINIRVDPEFRRELRHRAVDRDMTINELLLHYIYYGYQHDI
jgi:predicted HicB family RNase H-like nuclease